MSKLKKEDRPTSRAKAKEWFARTFPDRKIDKYDGDRTFFLAPQARQQAFDNVTFGKFTFTDYQASMTT